MIRSPPSLTHTVAGEASQHLFLCAFISDLTTRYGPVIREAKVIGVFDESFDVLVQIGRAHV